MMMFGHIFEKQVLKSPRNIIFSPHVDDEVIGCFTALEQGFITDVVYFHDLTASRICEAMRVSDRYGFKPWFCREPFYGVSEVPHDLSRTIDSTDTIWCPTSRDTHIQHVQVNRTARHYKDRVGCKLLFYTVDMESFQEPLPVEMREKKKAVLADLFPSQKVLLENEKYHLFEGYSEKDHLTTIRSTVGEFVVTMKGYNPPSEIKKPGDDELDESYLNRLVINHYDRVNVSTIAVTRGNVTVEFNG
jgi:hypothetical protein